MIFLARKAQTWLNEFKSKNCGLAGIVVYADTKQPQGCGLMVQHTKQVVLLGGLNKE